jgi:hypothetical protein
VSNHPLARTGGMEGEQTGEGGREGGGVREGGWGVQDDKSRNVSHKHPAASLHPPSATAHRQGSNWALSEDKQGRIGGRARNMGPQKGWERDKYGRGTGEGGLRA